MPCDWLLCWGSANENICCSHCCEVQKNCTRSRALAAGVVCTQRGGGFTQGRGGLHIALGDWQTDLYNCILNLIQAVVFAIFPHLHVHGPARDLNGSNHLCVAETVLAVPCCHLMFMTYIFRHCGLLILKIISIQAHRNTESVCVHVLLSLIHI